MSTVLNLTRTSPVGKLVTRLRTSLQLTQQELANGAGVLNKDVELLENNLPLPTGIKIKILMELQLKIQRIQDGYFLKDE